MGNVTEVMPILYIQSMYFTSKDEELNVFIPWRTFITKTSLQSIQSSHKESCCMLKKSNFKTPMVTTVSDRQKFSMSRRRYF